MVRIAVDVKWDVDCFKAFDKATGKQITTYSNLTYGGLMDDLKDSAIESSKGFDAITKVPKVAAIMTGWCDIP